MANDFEIRYKVLVDVDEKRALAAAAAVDSAFDKAIADIGQKTIVLPDVDLPVLELPQLELPPIVVPPISIPPISLPDLDLPETKSVSQLALDFDEATAAAKKLEAEQRSALAALIVAGDEGSDQYVELVAGIVDARRQSDELAAAQAKVNNIFKDLDAPDVTPAAVPELPDLGSRALEFNQISEIAERAASSIAAMNQPAIEFEASLAAVGAITGQSGPELEKLGKVGRELALQFGGPVTDQMASFQGVLSKFGAEVANTPAALGKISENINVLSKASGDDAATSMGAVTDSMLQFGLVTGDASKDAETSTRIINGLAASAQVGAAEIPQVAEAILQAGVAAKGANLDFEQTNAALQVLALGGKVGSEAGVSLRNVLGLLQNASGPAEEAMAKMGTSSKELGEVLTTQGLGPALDIIRAGMNNLGSDAERNASLMTIFGTENAAAAGILIENGAKLEEFEQGIRKGQEGMGAAFEQAAQRMDTAQGQIDRAKAFVEDAFISISQTLGAQVTAAASTFAELAPTLQGAAGLKELIPAGIFDKAGSALKGVLLPALTQLGIVKRINQAATVAETVAEVANTAAKGAQAVATGGATTAQYALNTAMLANPIFLITAGIAAAVGAFLLFSNSTKDLGTALEDANAAREEFVKADALATSAEKNSTELKKMADELDKLEGKGDPESVSRFNDVAAQLARDLPETSTALDTFGQGGEGVGKKFEVSTALVRQMADEQKRLADEARSNALANLDDQVGALSDSYREALETQKELREDKAKLQDAVASGLGDMSSTEVLGNPFDTTKDDLADTTAELAEQQKLINESRPQIESLVNTYQEIGLSVEDIAQRTGLTVEQVREFKGALDGTLVSSTQLEDAIKGMSGEQQLLVRSTALQAEGYAQAQAKVDELNKKLADAEFGGDKALTEKLKGELEEAQKLADEKKISLEAKLEETGVKEALDAIPEAARSKIIPLTTTLDVAVSEKSLAETQQKAGGVLREISELQKQQAEAIGTANEGAYDAKILAKQTEFRANLEKQAVAVAANEERLKQLRAAKDAATDPKEVARLSGEIITLEGKTDAAAKQFANVATQGKRVGAVQGDVKSVGTEFGFTGQAALGAARAVSEIDASNKKTARSASEMAAEFKKVRESATGALEGVKGEMIGLLAQIQATADAKIKADLQAKYQAKIDEAKKIAAGLIDGDRIMRQVEKDIGVTSLRDVEARQKEEENRRKEAEAKRRAALEEQRRAYEAQIKEGLAVFKAGEEARIAEMEDGLAKQIAIADLAVRVQEEENKITARLDAQNARLTREHRVLLDEARELALESAKRDRDKVLAEAAKDVGADLVKNDIERAKAAVEQIKLAADAIIDSDVDSIRARQALLRDVLRETNRIKLEELVTGSTEFQSVVAEQTGPEARAIVDAQLRLEQAKQTGNDELIRSAEALFEASKEEYAEKVRSLRDAFVVSQSVADTVLGQKIRNENATARTETTNAAIEDEKVLSAARSRQRIAGLEDLRRQEFELAQLAVDERLAADLQANKLNEAKKLELIREAHREKNALEKEYLRDTSVLWDAAYTDLSTIVTGFFAGMTADRRKELNEQIADIDAQVDKIQEELLRQEISISEFDSQVIDLLEERRALSDELNGSLRSFWENLAVGADTAFKSIQESMTVRLDGALADVNTTLDSAFRSAGDAAAMTAGDTGDKMDSFFERFSSDSEEVSKKLVEVANAASGQVLSMWGQMAISGKATLGDFADAAIVTSLKTIRTIVEGNIIGIVSAAFAINPFVGIGSIAAVLAVEVLLAKWESEAQARLGAHGFMKGGYTGDVPRDHAVGPAHGQEFVHTADVTAIPENRALFEHLHAGGSQLDWFATLGADLGFVTAADLESLYIDIHGQLRAGFDAMSALERQVAKSGVDPDAHRRVDVLSSIVAESRSTERAVLESYYATESAIAELRQNRNATLEAGSRTVAAVEKLEHSLGRIESRLTAYVMYRELTDYTERQETAETIGRRNRNETEFGLLRELIAAIREGRR